MKNKNILHVIIAAVVVVVGIIFFNLPHEDTSQVQTAKVASSTSEASQTSASSQNDDYEKNKVSHQRRKHHVHRTNQSESQSSSSESDSNDFDGYAGSDSRVKLFNIPKEFQGHWYLGTKAGTDTEVTIKDHNINEIILAQVDNKLFARSDFKPVYHHEAAEIKNIKGIKWILTGEMEPNSEKKIKCGISRRNNQDVLLFHNGIDSNKYDVLYKTEALAIKYAGDQLELN
ncbi:hypothetical protein [Lactobacillus psittaci]|nr:hypothetical protein [Lactobacillus psittaci]